ncbi:ABC transporter family substrate-binding protein [Actinotalea solisilvae]|uniref:ABC transporter family substrate-binding protein n=1 Tax=Actinotalea solisilvae TaxID=2072922 RepID=UPI0027DD5029|nr:ABC transporter family substrate-binding protein [Actinotalea solisilvae]
MRIRRIGAAGALVASGALVLSACATPTQSAIEEDTRLTVGWNQPFYSYNESTSNGNATANAVIKYLTVGSFQYYNDVPELVKDESYGTIEKLSDDPLTVKYTIAEDTQWSDEVPVDAADLLLQWVADSAVYNEGEVEYDEETGAIIEHENLYFDAAAIGGGLSNVTEVPEVGDDGKSITLVYDAPFVDWEIALAAPTVPAHVVAQKALDIEDAEEAKEALITAIQDGDTETLKPIADIWNSAFDFTDLPDDPSLYLASGPYVISELSADDAYITLTANENYTGDLEPKVETITVRYNEDPMAQVQALQNGELDIINPQATADVITALEGVDGVTVSTGVEATYEHLDLTYNNGGPFDPATYGGDEEKARLVRQAFLLAIPRQEVIDKIIKPLNPDAEIRNSQTRVPGSPGYDDIVASNGSDMYAEVDIEGAKALLAEAGVTTPIDVTMLYGKSNARRAAEYQLFAESVGDAGFNLIDGGDDNWGSLLGSGTYDVALFGWQSTSLGISESAANFRSDGGNNLTGYSSEKVDALYDELEATFDEEEQLRILGDVEKELWADGYGVTIFQFPGVVANRDTVSGVKNGVLSPSVFWNFWEWDPSESAVQESEEG